MSSFSYVPDEEIQIHRENAIRHMCQAFLSHENGLPEWVKNSAAAYLRDGGNRGNDRSSCCLLANNGQHRLLSRAWTWLACPVTRDRTRLQVLGRP